MKKVLIAGAGKIGSLIAMMLLESGRYEVCVIDSNSQSEELLKLIHVFPGLVFQSLDVSNSKSLQDYMQYHRVDAVVSALPYFLNELIAQSAHKVAVHYFDLTEDVQVTDKITQLAKGAKTAFVPQCGVAPGFINIATEYLMKQFDECFEVKLRVGGIPQYIDNVFHYGLTWSLDGLINQYINPCPAIENKVKVMHQPLQDLETLMIHGKPYEAFNTSGGVGHLVQTKLGKVQSLNYKTIRYPGHCEKIRFLIEDLKLKHHKTLLYQILEMNLPKIEDDVLLFYVSVTGKKDGQNLEKHYVHEILPHRISNQVWTAMQTATASSVCSVVDMVLHDPIQPMGLILHERFDLNMFLSNPFATCFSN
jgi:saccharopine dehydrogenase-like NADP-dependent oxidoreductase